MYKIGMFSKMNKVTVKALRHYDEMSLLKPAEIDEFTGYRYYSSEQLPILHQIVALRQIGFSLDEIAAVQNGDSPEILLQSKKVQLLQLIAESTLKLSQVEHYLMTEKDDTNMNYNVLLKDLPEVIVASMRTVIPNYDALFTVVPPMGEEMERLGCVCAEPEYCFNVYHDGEYRDENIDVEVCEAVTEAKQDSIKIKFKTISAVPLAACVLHKGSYSALPKAYGAIMKWMDSNGYEPEDNPRESYIDGIWNKDSESQWLTEVQFPIKKKE